MMRQTHPKIQLLPRQLRLETAFDVLDQFHTAISEGDTHVKADRRDSEIVNLLREMIYTAQETIAEIEERSPRQQPILRVMEKPTIRLEKAE